MRKIIEKMSIRGKFIAALAIIVPFVILMVAVIRTIQMRGDLIELHGVDADMSGLIRDVIVSLVPTVVGTILVAVIFIILFVRLLNPLEELAKAARDLAQGKAGVNLKIGNGSDELSDIALSLFKISQNLSTLRDDFSEAKRVIGSGNVNYRISNPNLHGVFQDVLASFNGIKDEFVGCLNIISESIIIVDGNHKVLFANNTIRNFTKTADIDVIGMHVNEFLNADIANHDYFRKTFSTGRPHVEDIIQLQLNREQVFDLELNCIPVKYQGATPAILLLLTNLTHIKDAQRLADKRDDFRIEQFTKLTKYIADAFSHGHLDVDFPKIVDFDSDTADIVKDFDAISGILTRSIGNINLYVHELQTTLYAMAEKDFDQVITREYSGDFSKIKDSVNGIVDSMNGFFSELSASSRQVQEGTEIIANNTQEMSIGFTEQLEFVSEINEQAHNISDEIKGSLESVRAATELSLAAKTDAQSGNAQMAAMLEAMEEIRKSSDTIALTIKTIQEIASQTNLLALNASVEAARAGEHGRGFSVVAEAVRALAIQATTASEESAEVLLTSKEKVGTGVKIAQETALSLDKIVTGVENIDIMIEKIASSAVRQSSSIHNIESGMEKINDMIKHDVYVVGNNAAATEELLNQANVLKDMLAEFKLRR